MFEKLSELPVWAVAVIVWLTVTGCAVLLCAVMGAVAVALRYGL